METKTQTRDEIVRAKRAEYMDSNSPLTHHEYYMWLAQFIGIPIVESSLPCKLEEVKNSLDPYLNDIKLQRWDNYDRNVRMYSRGISWSLSDSVSVLKTIALHLSGRQTSLCPVCKTPPERKHQGALQWDRNRERTNGHGYFCRNCGSDWNKETWITSTEEGKSNK